MTKEIKTVDSELLMAETTNKDFKIAVTTTLRMFREGDKKK